jgi:hypothetical protein
MKLVNFHQKPVSVFVMIAFMVMLCFWANQAPAVEKNSETTLEKGESGSPNFIEQENEAATTVKKSHKFPWLLVGVVVVIGAAAAYYFLVLNKKYTLTVSLGSGTTGTPAATSKFKKDESVPYNYSPQAGYGSLLVKLDGVAVAASGTVKMDKDRTLEVSATQEYTLTVTVGEGVTGTPVAGTSTYKKDTAVNYNYSLKSGYSKLSVTLDGAPIAASGTVTMNADHTLAASATKTFILTVSKGAHVNGTPASGTYTHASGTNVPYSYSPASGYSNLEVKLDNVLVANAGTIAMDTNHTLTANLYGANIVVNSTPAGARIYMDYVDSGFFTPHSFFFDTAVTKTVLLRYSCGYMEFTKTVSVNIGQTVTINATLVAGIDEDFNVPASSCWSPYYSASWSTSGGNYRYNGAAPKWSTNVYYHSFSGDYTVSVRMNRKEGPPYANAIFLGTGSSMTSASGYLLLYYSSGSYGIVRENSFNFITNSGSYTWIKLPTNSSAIQSGLNKWNTLKIIKVGSNYTCYINNVLLHSFNDATYNPSYCTLVFAPLNITTEMLYDYVYLDSGSGSGSVPGLPVQSVPATDKENSLWNPLTGDREG